MSEPTLADGAAAPLTKSAGTSPAIPVSKRTHHSHPILRPEKKLAKENEARLAVKGATAAKAAAIAPAGGSEKKAKKEKAEKEEDVLFVNTNS